MFKVNLKILLFNCLKVSLLSGVYINSVYYLQNMQVCCILVDKCKILIDFLSNMQYCFCNGMNFYMYCDILKIKFILYLQKNSI